MPQLNQLILTAADYKVIMNVPGQGTFPIQTAESFSWDNSREDETIYAIGEEDPIGEKRNGAKYSGRLAMQVGELNAILQLLGLVEASQIANITFSITAIQGGFSRTYSGFNINSESVDIKAKDKHSVANMAWKALSIN
jgi:hypothetical protein